MTRLLDVQLKLHAIRLKTFDCPVERHLFIQVVIAVSRCDSQLQSINDLDQPLLRFFNLQGPSSISSLLLVVGTLAQPS